ncbi:MAG: carboxypeptidase regulatory-like domain-containing protein [Planctomycetaceae bacterium]|nr:carboxypeptidase regulatory-like domain-containing protein [Planctomycetaceae bacterium]
MTYFLGIDCGSTMVKAAVFDDGKTRKDRTMKRTALYRVIGTMILWFVGSLVTLYADETASVPPQITDFDVVFEKVALRGWRFPAFTEVRTVNETGEPVADTRIEVVALKGFDYVTRERPEFYREEFQSDNNGVAVITYRGFENKTFDGLQIIASSGDRHLPASLLLSQNREASIVDVPEKMEAILVLAKTYTRQVMDEATEKGIEGVELRFHPKVDVTAITTNTEKKLNDVVSLVPMAERLTVLTDQIGFFEIGPLPHDETLFKAGFLSIEHPEYFNSTQFDDKDSIPEQFTMKKKPEIIGRVTDAEGKPVAEATITMQNGRKTLAKTDQDGHFRIFSPFPNTGFEFLVQASGMKSVGLKIAPDQFNMPINVTLQKGNTILIRAIDEKGKTLSPIVVRRYFGMSSPGLPNHYLMPDVVPGRILENGIWEWNDAPRGEIWAWVYDQPQLNPEQFPTPYIAELPLYRFRPREEPYTVRMLPLDKEQPRPFIPAAVGWTVPPKMVVRVVDYDTEEPCANAFVSVIINGNVPTMTFVPFAPFPPFMNTETFRTDANGLVGLDFNEIDESDIQSIGFAVLKEGYTELTLGWQTISLMPNYPPVAAAPPPAPDTTLELVRRSRNLVGASRFGPPIPEVLDMVLVKKEE